MPPQNPSADIMPLLYMQMMMGSMNQQQPMNPYPYPYYQVPFMPPKKKKKKKKPIDEVDLFVDI